MSNLDWDDFDIDPEEITEAEAKEIDEGTGEYPPIGKYLCRVIEAMPKRIDFSKYSCVGVTLKFEIEQALEIEAKPVTGDEGEKYEGKHIFDDVAFQHDDEKPGMAKRRKMVALRLGIIQPGETLRKDIWKDSVVGKKIILQLDKNVYTDKRTGEEKIGRPQVGFFTGYLPADRKNETAEESEWGEI